MADAHETIPPDRTERSMPHFFKVYFPSTCSERLGIPPSFWKHIEHEPSSGRASLTGPSGNVWHCSLMRNAAGGVSFSGGWYEFAADHSLAAGDFLVFRYEGGLHFTVLIFDSTACEREKAFGVTPCREDTVHGGDDDEESENSVEVLMITDPQTNDKNFSTDEANSGTPSSEQGSMTPQIGPLKLRQTLEAEHNGCQCATSCKDCDVSSGEKNGMCSRDAPKCSLQKRPLSSTNSSEMEQLELVCSNLQSGKVKTCPSSGASTLQQRGVTNMRAQGASKPHNSHENCRGKSREKTEKHSRLSVSARKRSCEDHAVRLIRQKSHSCRKSVSAAKSKVRMEAAESHRRPVTEEEKKKALEAAKSFRSEHPFCLSVMRESYVYHGFYMSLPVALMKHLPQYNMVMILWDPRGRSWTVKYNYCKNRGAFSAGWVAVCHANNLESDDVCVFELFKPNEVRVHIFRAVEEVNPAMSFE